MTVGFLQGRCVAVGKLLFSEPRLAGSSEMGLVTLPESFEGSGRCCT